MPRMVDSFEVVSEDVTFDHEAGPFTGSLAAPEGTKAISAGVNTGGPGGVLVMYPEADLSAWNFSLTSQSGTATLYIVCVS